MLCLAQVLQCGTVYLLRPNRRLTMQIDSLDLGSRPLLLAPMEDVSDAPFRLLCKQFGASLVYTEFISADALVRYVPSTMRKMRIDPAERPEMCIRDSVKPGVTGSPE